VGPRAGLDLMASKKKFPCPAGHETPVDQPVAYTEWAIAVPLDTNDYEF
jgi:hypothetical protein